MSLPRAPALWLLVCDGVAEMKLTLCVCSIIYVGIAAEGVLETAKGGCCCHQCGGEPHSAEHPTDKPVTPTTV